MTCDCVKAIVVESRAYGRRTRRSESPACILGKPRGWHDVGGGRGIEGKARVWRNSCQVVLCGACLFFGGLSSLEIEGGEVVLDSPDECDGGRLVEGPRQWPEVALVSVNTG